MYENGRYEAEIIETTDEEGQVHVFEKIDEIEIDDEEYALLVYKGENVEEHSDEEGYEEEVVVMKISYEDGVEVYEQIEDEEEFQRVVKFIEEMSAEDGDFVVNLGDLLSELSDDDEDDEPESLN